MNLYMRSIGFSNLQSTRQLDAIIKKVTDSPDEQYILGKNNSDVYIEYYKSFGENFGLVVRGSMDEQEKVTIDYCYPYSLSAKALPCVNVEVEYIDGEYLVIGEEIETGNELVFQLQNVLDFLDEEDYFDGAKHINIVGLSTNGTIILPVLKDEASEKMRKEEDRFYRELIQKARKGDDSARQLLDIQEEETTAMMRERLQEEDFLSVVEGFFMPNDSDETAYSILGDIEDVDIQINQETEETVYRLLLNVTGTKIEVCVNELDLLGLPSVGMRFMGNCWLQGKIVF